MTNKTNKEKFMQGLENAIIQYMRDGKCTHDEASMIRKGLSALINETVSDDLDVDIFKPSKAFNIDIIFRTLIHDQHKCVDYVEHVKTTLKNFWSGKYDN